MSDVVIKVENLGKLYKIGAQQERYKTLRESLMGAVTGPLRRLRSHLAAISHQPSAIGNQLPSTSHLLPSISHQLSAISSKQSNFIWALKDVSFEVKQGEVVGIIGRNGAGKSTLLKVLSHITEPTEGRVALRGRVGSLLEVGTGFHPELTGRENIYLNGAILGMRRVEIDRKFDEIVAFAEIDRFLDTPVKRYSSGMYVRLAFAVAAHLEPEILLVDEVLAVGDAEFQKKCLGKMGDVAHEGRTVLFVSHNMVAIEGLCTRAIVLSNGILINGGDVNQCIDYYYEMGKTRQDLPLELRKDRQGRSHAQAMNITIIDGNGQHTNAITMGDSFTVELKIKGYLRSGIVGILIGNQFRSQLIRGYTWENMSENVSINGTSLLKCRFDHFPLVHGTYHVHVWIAERQGNQNVLEDYVEKAATLVINPVDLYGNGRILDSTICIAYCRTEWEIVNLES